MVGAGRLCPGSIQRAIWPENGGAGVALGGSGGWGHVTGSAGEVLPHRVWLFMLLSRSLLEEECHMLQREVSDLQVSTALSLPPGSLLSRDHARVSVDLHACQGCVSPTPVSRVSEAMVSSFRLTHLPAPGLWPPLSSAQPPSC